MLWKCCTQYASKSRKLSSGYGTGKGQFSSQSQRKAMPKNSQATTQLHSSHTLVKSCSKLSKPGFNGTWTVKFLMFKLDLGKTEETEINLPTFVGSLKSKRVPRKRLFLLYWLGRSLWLCGSQQTVKNSSRDSNTWPSDLLPEKPISRSGCNSQTAQGTTDCFKIGKGAHQDCMLSPCLFNLCTESIMRNAGLDGTQAGLKTGGRNISNLRYADNHP